MCWSTLGNGICNIFSLKEKISCYLFVGPQLIFFHSQKKKKKMKRFVNLFLICPLIYSGRKHTKEFCCICLVNQILCALQKQINNKHRKSNLLNVRQNGVVKALQGVPGLSEHVLVASHSDQFSP